jgi:hypothetical protein
LLIRGDFLALIGRSHPQERALAETIDKWWKFYDGEDAGSDSNLRTVDFELQGLPYNRDPTSKELLDHSYFWLSDHSRFWYYRDTSDLNIFMPALLLTDTGTRSTSYNHRVYV